MWGANNKGFSTLNFVAAHESVVGPLRRLRRRSDLVASGGEADIAQSAQIGRS